jgi:hypothetical protein
LSDAKYACFDRRDFWDMLVRKADGSFQQFDNEKVARTCLRMGADKQTAYEIASKVETRLYEGIPTSKILQMVFQYMRRCRPCVRNLLDLRKGISLMGSKPEFEAFVRAILARNGFEVSPNQLLIGKCVLHEVDGVVRKNGFTYFLEAKHHLNYHALTGLDESRIARAVLEDVAEGFALGRSVLKIDGAMIVTNTRYSEEAMQYGRCRGILQIGWSLPSGHGLQDLIEGTNLFPLSCLRNLKRDVREKLVNSGVVLFEQMLNEETAELARKTRLPQRVIRKIRDDVVLGNLNRIT